MEGRSLVTRRTEGLLASPRRVTDLESTPTASSRAELLDDDECDEVGWAAVGDEFA